MPELQVPKPTVFRNKRLVKVISIFPFFILNCSLSRGRLVKTDKISWTSSISCSVCLVYYNNTVLSKIWFLSQSRNLKNYSISPFYTINEPFPRFVWAWGDLPTNHFFIRISKIISKMCVRYTYVAHPPCFGDAPCEIPLSSIFNLIL